MTNTTPARLRQLLFLIALSASAALLASCSGGGEKKEEAKPTTVAETKPEEPDVPKMYDDAAWQARFKFWYLTYLNEFEPLDTGMKVRLKFKQGEDITGEFGGFTNDAVIVTTVHGVTNFPPAVLSDDTQEKLVLEHFAAGNAKRVVDTEREKNPAGPPTGVPDVTAEGQKVVEERFAASEGSGLDIRMGPGKSYKPVDGAQVTKGTMISILEEREGWIRFITTGKDGKPISVWVNKFATIPLDSLNVPSQEKDLKTLMDSGVIVAFEATNNEAKVNIDLWNEMDQLVRQGIGRSLAFYCGSTRSNNLNWVEFKDAKSGQRVAKYSEALGFKVYQIR